MSVYHIAADRLEEALIEIVRGHGETIDKIERDHMGNWLVITEDHPTISTRGIDRMIPLVELRKMIADGDVVLA